MVTARVDARLKSSLLQIRHNHVGLELGIRHCQRFPFFRETLVFGVITKKSCIPARGTIPANRFSTHHTTTDSPLIRMILAFNRFHPRRQPLKGAALRTHYSLLLNQ